MKRKDQKNEEEFKDDLEKKNETEKSKMTKITIDSVCTNLSCSWWAKKKNTLPW